MGYTSDANNQYWLLTIRSPETASFDLYVKVFFLFLVVQSANKNYLKNKKHLNPEIFCNELQFNWQYQLCI